MPRSVTVGLRTGRGVVRSVTSRPTRPTRSVRPSHDLGMRWPIWTAHPDYEDRRPESDRAVLPRVRHVVTLQVVFRVALWVSRFHDTGRDRLVGTRRYGHTQVGDGGTVAEVGGRQNVASPETWHIWLCCDTAYVRPACTSPLTAQRPGVDLVITVCNAQDPARLPLGSHQHPLGPVGGGGRGT